MGPQQRNAYFQMLSIFKSETQNNVLQKKNISGSIAFYLNFKTKRFHHYNMQSWLKFHQETPE